MNFLIDSHCHIQFPIYGNSRKQAILNAQKAGVKMVASGTQFSTSLEAVKIANEYPNDIWATVGFHPNHLVDEWHHDKAEQAEEEKEVFDIKKIAGLAEDKKVIAIGECGLDYFRLGTDAEKVKKAQEKVFLEQTQLAKEIKKPLVIHCRPSKKSENAYEDIFGLLKSAKPENEVIFHFFAGNLETAKKFANAGFNFTFGGVITFARDYDEIIRYLPLDKILLETDSPYVAPEPYRGKRNEPAFVAEVYKKMAEIKNLDYDILLKAIEGNFKRIFKTDYE